MSIGFGQKAVLICSITALVISLAICTDTSSIAATASATARMQVLPSMISMTLAQTSPQTKDTKPCEHRFLLYYTGQADGSVLISQTSAQCTSVYEIPAKDGSLIVLP